MNTGQRLGNDFGTALTKVVAASKAAQTAGEAPENSDDDLGTDDVDRKLKAGKLEALERTNRMASLEEAAANGAYVDAAEAAAEMGKIASPAIDRCKHLVASVSDKSK